MKFGRIVRLWNEYASNDGSRISPWRHTLKMATMTSFPAENSFAAMPIRTGRCCCLANANNTQLTADIQSTSWCTAVPWTWRSLCSTGTNRLLLPPVKRSTVVSRAFPVAGPKTWNALREDVTSSQSEYTFRRQFKTFLFKKSFPDCSLIWYWLHLDFWLRLVCSNFEIVVPYKDYDVIWIWYDDIVYRWLALLRRHFEHTENKIMVGI